MKYQTYNGYRDLSLGKRTEKKKREVTMTGLLGSSKTRGLEPCTEREYQTVVDGITYFIVEDSNH